MYIYVCFFFLGKIRLEILRNGGQVCASSRPMYGWVGLIVLRPIEMVGWLNFVHKISVCLDEWLTKIEKISQTAKISYIIRLYNYSFGNWRLQSVYFAWQGKHIQMEAASVYFACIFIYFACQYTNKESICKFCLSNQGNKVRKDNSWLLRGQLWGRVITYKIIIIIICDK